MERGMMGRTASLKKRGGVHSAQPMTRVIMVAILICWQGARATKSRETAPCRVSAAKGKKRNGSRTVGSIAVGGHGVISVGVAHTSPTALGCCSSCGRRDTGALSKGWIYTVTAYPTILRSQARCYSSRGIWRTGMDRANFGRAAEPCHLYHRTRGISASTVETGDRSAES
ncbi:hypothetical protein F5Y03DRAFT_89448 [Xylaria venustula]|nr:hypothetical protein F5Y03DRAFT_89448 [Xylaria venustula]